MAAWLWSIPADRYPTFAKTRTFALRRIGRRTLARVRPGDVIFAYLSGRKAIAGQYEVVGEPFEDATPLVAGVHLPHRVRVRPVIELAREDWLATDTLVDDLAVVEGYPSFRVVAQQVLHALPRVDEKVLAFLLRTRNAANLEKMLAAYQSYLQDRPVDEPVPVREPTPVYTAAPFDAPAAMEALLAALAAQGYIYAPWQVAAYVTALRTKPFVILAGVTGTGKSQLPRLVAEATGGVATLIPVRPDWTDSADVLGYLDLQGRFRPGAVLAAARTAMDVPHRHHVCLLDEMNLARVEHYFAEVLSRLEDRRPAPGGLASPPVLADNLRAAAEARWAAVHLPPNLGLVGTVNMDESAHGFSRKVLDRAFTLELAEVDLRQWQPAAGLPAAQTWPLTAWQPRATKLADLDPDALTREEEAVIDHAVATLADANTLLQPAQVHVAYRSRDEVALFVLHAQAWPDAFRTATGAPVDPLDLALLMKVLPRLSGGSPALRYAVLGLLGWAATGTPCRDEQDARPLLDAWTADGRAVHLPGMRFPRTTARLCWMTERLLTEGYTAYWF